MKTRKQAIEYISKYATDEFIQIAYQHSTITDIYTLKNEFKKQLTKPNYDTKLQRTSRRTTE